MAVTFAVLTSSCRDDAEPSMLEVVDTPPVGRPTALMSRLMAGDAPEGVILRQSGSMRASASELRALTASMSAAAPTSTAGADASRSAESLDCDPNTEACMGSYALPNLYLTEIEYEGGAYMTELGFGASVSILTNLMIERKGYPLGLDYIPYFGTALNTNSVALNKSWSGTCAEGRRNSIVGTQRTFAGRLSTLTYWGPRYIGINDICYEEDGSEGDDGACDDGELDEDVMPDVVYPPNNCVPGTGGGGSEGGTSTFECGWYQYEISFDGGLTWYPYGDPFIICEWVNASIVADSSTVTTGGSNDQRAMKIVGTDALDDGAHAYVVRALGNASPLSLEVDTNRTLATNVEAAFIGASALRAATFSEAGATHVRMKVGTHALTAAGRARARERGRATLEAVKAAPRQNVGGSRAGRTLTIDVESVPTQRRPKP